MEIVKIKNKRLSKYLYSLGFERTCYSQPYEYWVFKKSDNLNEALDFYFYMRKKNR